MKIQPAAANATTGCCSPQNNLSMQPHYTPSVFVQAKIAEIFCDSNRFNKKYIGDKDHTIEHVIPNDSTLKGSIKGLHKGSDTSSRENT